MHSEPDCFFIFFLQTLDFIILPLIESIDSQGRVHCSLNLNTETGRLSARRPNL